MKIKMRKEQEFTGRVEVAVSAIDERGNRLSAKADMSHRKSIRLEETSVIEVFGIILKALEEHCKKEV